MKFKSKPPLSPIPIGRQALRKGDMRKQNPLYFPLDEGGRNKEGRRNFVRKVEDFECENCGKKVVGDGYTDHCPRCLWGKHVDLEIPGDRKSECRGLMEPVGVVYKSGEFKINYQCVKCHHKFLVKSGKNDDREKLIVMGRI